ncbi:hypothetical protein GC101_28155 [Paenibacillus sp. LMG 31459]|uniref:Transcriptional regulator TetR C-terminal Firmicutes type domain-containing protein n=1 Tax=Paenibacillus phytohabitans TaxID=2654978 RepID=A0ABX1YS72_9BACL|nr:TetR/AcrR family transcriptional regulator [Paenibacillus phytohabitans]NOU82741.1 hypothetical protein [Paenibacillus phytohabitans]
MVGVKNNRRTKYTINLIKESFLILLETKKLPQITVTEICNHADINRGTFYLHYKDPFELFEIMQSEFNKELEETLQEGDRPCTSEESMINLLNIIQDKKTMYQILISESGKNSFLLRALLEQNWNEAFSTNYSFTYKVYGSIGVINQWLESNGAESPETIAKLILSLGHENINV